jgi:phosphohistidine phosphatase SixA
VVAALTRDVDQAGAVLFVGHEPDMSLTIAALTGGRVVMKKGGFARVDVTAFQPFRGALVWLIAPKLFESRR